MMGDYHSLSRISGSGSVRGLGVQFPFTYSIFFRSAFVINSSITTKLIPVEKVESQMYNCPVKIFFYLYFIRTPSTAGKLVNTQGI